MDVNNLLLLAIFTFLIQLGIFFLIRKHKRSVKKNDPYLKYGIKSRHDAWLLMNDPELPDKDREVIEQLYAKMS